MKTGLNIQVYRDGVLETLDIADVTAFELRTYLLSCNPETLIRFAMILAGLIWDYTGTDNRKLDRRDGE